MEEVKYTFLLPAYKPNFLEEALVSIKEQTYTDFKVIVSDDCSPHDLKSIFEKTCGDDPRFVFRRNEKNMGCLLYTSPSPRDANASRMPSSA